jgi:UDP-N-acetylmuramate--alanine ligase
MSPLKEKLREQILRLSPIHFIGVGGSGMAPLAGMTLQLGAAVTGSDVTSTNAITANALFRQGDHAELEALSKAKTLVYSSAISQNHKSLERGRELGKKIIHRSDLLAIFCNNLKTIAVAGTHGKTTTSALITHILRKLDRLPSWIIGAAFSDGNAAFYHGDSDYLVIEADESDGSIIKYHPFISVLNNIEPDHLDFYGSFENLRRAFAVFIQNTSENGSILYNADDLTVKNLVSTCKNRNIGFGSHGDAGARLLHTHTSGLLTAGELLVGTKNVSFKMPLTGRHNAINASAALAVGHALGLDPFNCAKALADFPGVARRLQLYQTRSGALVFDDYAHNPGKIKSCLSGLVDAFPNKRILAVFQPHRFSRLMSLYKEFLTSFKFKGLRVIITPVYAAGEPPLEDLTPQRLALDIANKSNVEAFHADSLKEAVELVKSMMDQKLDLLVTVGAGDVWHVARDVAGEL